MFKDVLNNIEGTEIKSSSVDGNGLFATQDIPAGIELCLLDGQVIEWDRFHDIVAMEARRNKEAMTQALKNYRYKEWNCIAPDKLLVRHFRTKYSFINHSLKAANLKLLGSNPKLTLWTSEDIAKGEELLINYTDEPLPKEYLDLHGSSYLL